MVEFDEIKQSLTNMKPKINSLSEAVSVEELKGKIKNLEEIPRLPNGKIDINTLKAMSNN